jgi:predicted nucleic-acid-binding Zn-ribbon protein
MQKGMAQGKCPKCDSTNIVRDTAFLPAPTNVLTLKGNKVAVFMCGQCGFIELYYAGKHAATPL